jgi:hypothetical protein
MSTSVVDDKIISWAQYLHWADLNFDRYLFSNDDEKPSVKIALACHWFASEYVVIEGWLKLKNDSQEIKEFLFGNEDVIDLLRRARNAVYHFQDNPLDKRLEEFITDGSRVLWLAQLHKKFVEYLIEYPTLVWPFKDHGRDEFASNFYELIGWVPCAIKNI